MIGTLLTLSIYMGAGLAPMIYNYYILKKKLNEKAKEPKAEEAKAKEAKASKEAKESPVVVVVIDPRCLDVDEVKSLIGNSLVAAPIKGIEAAHAEAAAEA